MAAKLEAARQSELFGDGTRKRGGKDTLGVGFVVSEKGGLREGMCDG